MNLRLQRRTICSPLRSISQYAEILNEEAKSLGDEQRGYLERIQVLSQTWTAC